MSEPTKVRVTTVPAQWVDRRFPAGEIMVEVLTNGDVHIAYREHEWDTWPAGAWVTPD